MDRNCSSITTAAISSTCLRYSAGSALPFALAVEPKLPPSVPCPCPAAPVTTKPAPDVLSSPSSADVRPDRSKLLAPAPPCEGMAARSLARAVTEEDRSSRSRRGRRRPAARSRCTKAVTNAHSGPSVPSGCNGQPTTSAPTRCARTCATVVCTNSCCELAGVAAERRGGEAAGA
jgi:hypothetical protein